MAAQNPDTEIETRCLMPRVAMIGICNSSKFCPSPYRPDSLENMHDGAISSVRKVILFQAVADVRILPSPGSPFTPLALGRKVQSEGECIFYRSWAQGPTS